MFLDKKQLNNRRSSVRNTLRAERERAASSQKYFAQQLLRKRKLDMETYDKRSVTDSAILFSTAQMAHKVLGAFGVSIPINVSALYSYADTDIRAYTDFKTITVQAKTNAIDLKDFESVAEFVFKVKGAVYHEGGHVLFTEPFSNLMEYADTHPVLKPRVDQVISSTGLGVFQRCWNIIEDQRMEMAMVTVSPMLSTYFTSVVLNVVVNKDELHMNWPYLTGRTYLPMDIRREFRRKALASKCGHLVTAIDSVVARYRVARTKEEMIVALLDFYGLMLQWGLMSSEHETRHSHYHRPSGSKGPKELPDMDPRTGYEGESNEPEDEESEGEGAGGSPEADKDGNPAESEAKGSANDEVDEGTPQPSDRPTNDSQPKGNDNDSNGKSGENANDPGGQGAGKGKGDLNDLINEALEALKPKVTADIKEFVSSINEELTKELRRDETMYPMRSEDVAEAVTIKSGIISSLEHLIDQTSPSWRFRQEHGVLDPTAYVMREPGDTDYWSGLDDMGNRGFDLSVSVILDTSYSMENHTDKVSRVGLGIRLACDELDIPCDVSTFNSVEGAVYRAGEPTQPVTVRANGGTEPAGILSMLDSQRHDKRRHLVVILTDGEWSECPSLSPYSAPGRYFLLVGFNMYHDGVLVNKRPNAHALIQDLNELGGKFTRALSGFMY